ncbi:MAG TPA: hypothetical protein ENH10_04380 [Bacteroidetes bacterium]|nr:hypothetical protein [Bacteroidota bacterium]HEX04376.1 hypothetical protein [Bacteroidota bacterium]
MSDSFVDFGEILDSQSHTDLTISHAQKTFAAIQEHPAFTLIEFRWIDEDDSYSELLVVECRNDAVPTRNRVGINYCERLALRFFRQSDRLPEVRALRSDFPATPHQNHIRPGEPASICLYFEPWSSVERSWTPQKHLNRILWWLSNTANESLHRGDQPVEQLYFQSRYKLVLPPDYEEKVNDKALCLIVEPRLLRENDGRIIASSFISSEEASQRTDLYLSCLALSLPPVVHGAVEYFPSTLGQLHDQFERRGVDLSSLVFEDIQRLADGNGLPETKELFTLLVLAIPLLRESDGELERLEHKAFVIGSSLGNLGVLCGILHFNDGRYWRAPLVGGADQVLSWRDLTVEPLEVLPSFTKGLARTASGIVGKGPNGVLAGLGALGSAIMNIWQRQGWGTWSLIDHDYIKPHNLARHTAYESQVGSYKVDSVQNLESAIYPADRPAGKAIAGSASNFSSDDVVEVLNTADLVVDATTTLEFPRDLSLHGIAKRAASIFITPSGLGSVLLIEDAGNSMRLDKLEPQYYRSLINSPWGETHLVGSSGHLWVGAGCRDISAVIPNEHVQLHASILARQIRLHSEQPEANIQVWSCNGDSGAVETDVIVPMPPIVVDLGDMRLVWDEGLRDRVQELRDESLPNETGGILLGYFDLKLSNVYVVDVVSAPVDSQGSQTGFTRGVEGLQEYLRIVKHKTAGIVGYVGEWHSHPSQVSANPSSADMIQLTYLADELRADGLPALMLIVGEHEETWLAADAMGGQ